MDRISRKEIIDRIAEESKLTKIKSKIALNAIIEVIKETLQDKKEVRIKGFGKFGVKHRKAKIGIDMINKIKINIPEKDAPVFKFSKKFKDSFKDDKVH